MWNNGFHYVRTLHYRSSGLSLLCSQSTFDLPCRRLLRFASVAIIVALSAFGFFLLILNSISCALFRSGELMSVTSHWASLSCKHIFCLFECILFHFSSSYHFASNNILFCLWSRDIANQRLLCLRSCSQ